MPAELHVQLSKVPAEPYPQSDVVCMVHRTSVRVEKEFRTAFAKRDDDDDWKPYVFAFICPHLMDAKIGATQEFVWWLESLIDESPNWTFDSGEMRIFNLSKQYVEQVRNRLSATRFQGLAWPTKYDLSVLTAPDESDRLVTPVIFMTYRRKDIRDL